MSEPILILTPRQVDDTFKLQAAALERGWQVGRLENWRVPHYLAERETVIYGEPLFVEVVAQTLGVALLQTPYDWLAQLPEHYLQRKVSFTNLGEARLLTRPMFVKPVEGKSFVACVYTHGTELLARDLLPDETPVLISEPVHWEVEFRCFVLDDQVVTYSPYLCAGELAEDENGNWPASQTEYSTALTFAQTVLSDKMISAPAAFVLDVGMLGDRDWAVIESNAAWGAGLYGCAPTEVLRILRRACIKKEQLMPKDEPWILPFGEIIP
jgi:ATP-grasp domain, R2K clade family 2